MGRIAIICGAGILLVSLSACSPGNPVKTLTPQALTSPASELPSFELTPTVRVSTPTETSQPTIAPEQDNSTLLPLTYSGPLPDGAHAVLGVGQTNASASPDGAFLVIQSASGAMAYDLNALEPLWNEPKQGGQVTWLLDGNGVAIGPNIWDIHTGELTRTRSSKLKSGVWSPDGITIALASRRSSILLYDAISGAELHELDLPQELKEKLPNDVPGWDLNISFSPHGTLIGATYHWIISDGYNGDGNELAIWNVKTGNLIHEFSPATGWEYESSSVAWSPDGERVAALQLGGGANIWDVFSGELLKRIDRASYIVWDPTNSQFAISALSSGTTPGETVIWDNSTLEKKFSVSDSTDNVIWSLDGSQVAIVRHDVGQSDVKGSIVFYDTGTGEPGTRLPDADQIVAFSPNGNWLISGLYSYVPINENAVVAWDLSKDPPESTLMIKGTSPVFDLAWSRNGQTIASITGVSFNHGTTLTEWDSATGQAISTGQVDDVEFNYQLSLNRVSWSSDGYPLMLGNDDQTAVVWRYAGGFSQTTLSQGIPGPVSPDGAAVVVVDETQISIDNTKTGFLISNWRADGQMVTDSAWSPDGKLLAVTTSPATLFASWSQAPVNDGEVAVYNVQSGTLISKMEDVTGIPLSVAWSPDGLSLAVGFSRDDKIVRWDVASKKPQSQIAGNVSVNAEMGYFHITWSPDGNKLAAAYSPPPFYPDCMGCRLDDSGEVVVWDLSTGKAIFHHSFNSNVEAVAFDPQSTFLATGSRDGLILVWGLN